MDFQYKTFENNEYILPIKLLGWLRIKIFYNIDMNFHLKEFLIYVFNDIS